MKNKQNELHAMTPTKLEMRVEELRREMLKLRLNSITAPSKSFASIKNQLKKDIARALTVLQQKTSQTKG